MTSEPITYRRIVLQEAKIQKLEELDVFDELADIDYLSNLKTKVADTVNGLLSKGLIPANFNDLFIADFQRVCSIRKIFSMKPGSFGARLDEIEKLRKELSSPSHSFEKSDLGNLQKKLTDFEQLWNEVYPKISRLHYARDWSSSSSLETYLNEYYMLENNDDFLTNVSKALLLFIHSPTELEAKIKDKITDFREFITKCKEEHEQAKLKEPEIKKLCDEGKLESLKENIDQVKRFKDIALHEKKQLVLFDHLVEEKKEIDKKLSSISKDSNKKTSKEQLALHFLMALRVTMYLLHLKKQNLPRVDPILEELKIVEIKAKKLLAKSNSLSHGLSLCLAAHKTTDRCKERISKVEKTIKRKRQSFKIIAAFLSLIVVGILAPDVVHQLELEKQERQRKLAKQARTKAAHEKLGDEFTIPASNIEMIWVQPGTFMMGSPTTEEGRLNSEIQHVVTLTNGFYLGKYEVTQFQYNAVMNENPSEFVGNNRPVEQVSLDDAVEFCDKLTEIERIAGRLPEGMIYPFPRKRSGSMPAEQARPRRTRGGIALRRAMLITVWDYQVVPKPVMLAHTIRTPGAFSICMAMWRSGRRTGMQDTVQMHRPILRARLRARRTSFGSHGVVPFSTTGRPCVPLSATTTTPRTTAVA